MPKITKSGIFSTKYEIPEKPPEGVKSVCQFCNAELETEKNEKKFSLAKKSFRGVLFVGWNIRCPECRRAVFFCFTDISSEVLGKINGYGK